MLCVFAIGNEKGIENGTFKKDAVWAGSMRKSWDCEPRVTSSTFEVDCLLSWTILAFGIPFCALKLSDITDDMLDCKLEFTMSDVDRDDRSVLVDVEMSLDFTP